MKIETLEERIQKAQEKIAKKENTIEKKRSWIAKKERAMENEPNASEREDMKYDIEWWQEDIDRIKKEIKETEKTIEKYQKQLDGEMERDRLLKTVPESVKSMQDELVKRWDEYDIGHRDYLRQQYEALDYNEFRKRYGYRGYEEKSLTDKQIHDANMNDSRTMIIDLIYRVRDKVGEITSWADVRATGGTRGLPVLNGGIIGKEGRCRIESIGAGGYNVQRYHIRVLVKDWD